MIRSRPAQGFTLVELIVVMGLLALTAALVVPSLARSMRDRNLRGEAARFLAATEYARDEAVSQGVPMTVWINREAGKFGVEVRTGFDGIEARNREFALNPDVSFEITNGVVKNGVIEAVEFAPDGAPESSSINSLRLVDRFKSAFTIARTNDGWSYEILPETK